MLLLSHCFFSEPFQPVIKCLGVHSVLLTPPADRLSALHIRLVYYLPILKPYLCLRLCYLIHSNTLQSGLWTSLEFFEFCLTLSLVCIKSRDGLVDTPFLYFYIPFLKCCLSFPIRSNLPLVDLYYAKNSCSIL